MSIKNKQFREQEPTNEIEKFFSFQNPNVPAYQKLSQEHESNDTMREMGEEYADVWSNLLRYLDTTEELNGDWLTPEQKQEIKKYLLEKLEGSTVIDLGCGSRMRNPAHYRIKPAMLQMIERFAIGKYIGVDVQGKYDVNTDQEIEEIEPIAKLPGSGFYLGGYDMLTTIAKAPSNSANITINGIDFNIVSSEDYNKALAQEIVRVCRQGGIIFGISSEALSFIDQGIASREDFEIKRAPFNFSIPVKIFEKIST